MKPIRLAIIGCGNFLKHFHVPVIKKCSRSLKLVAVSDASRERAESLAAEHFPKSDVAIHTDHLKMLKDAAPEAVIVSSPHTLHFRHCYDALSAGAHVMVEKPMVTDSGDARKLVARAKARKRTLTIAIQGLYTDTFAYARKLIDDGTIGKMQLISGIMAQGWMRGTTGSWRQKPELSGGGQLYDSTSHVLSAMMFLAGSPVREVFCWADKKRTPVDINAVGLIRFASGAMGSITSGGDCNSWLSRVTVQCEKASMGISAHGGDFIVNGVKLKKDITKTPAGWKLPTVSPVQNFIDVIRGKAKPRCTGELGIILADLMDALYKSISTGKPARVTRRPPKMPS